MELACATETFSRAAKRSGTIAPMAGWSWCSVLRLALPGAASGGTTALVFSVFRFGISLSAMACSAVLSFWPSASLSGAACCDR